MQEQEQKQQDFTKYNAKQVLEKLEWYINSGISRDMYQVCEPLSIFDWWVDNLSVSKMKQMRTFLKNAIKLGFDGYVCFKVGAKCCSNGMWAHKKTSQDGYSPDGDYIYRSFSPDYTCYSGEINGIDLTKDVKYDSIKTISQLKKAILNVA